MRAIMLAVAVVLVVGFTVLATQGTAAAPNSTGACRQAVHDALVASSAEGTQGDAIADGFYGNEPNMVDGTAGGPSEQEPGTQADNVAPSQSPGPKVTNPDGSVRAGASWGDVQQTVIKPTCNA